jgi:hypothetical protein
MTYTENANKGYKIMAEEANNESVEAVDKADSNDMTEEQKNEALNNVRVLKCRLYDIMERQAVIGVQFKQLDDKKQSLNAQVAEKESVQESSPELKNEVLALKGEVYDITNQQEGFNKQHQQLEQAKREPAQALGDLRRNWLSTTGEPCPE